MGFGRLPCPSPRASPVLSRRVRLPLQPPPRPPCRISLSHWHRHGAPTAYLQHAGSRREATQPAGGSAAMTDNETLMLETFIAQITAILLGSISIAAANCLFDDGHIRWRLHSVWVSYSITGICFPVVAWASTVFLGSSVLSHGLIGVFG